MGTELGIEDKVGSEDGTDEGTPDGTEEVDGVELGKYEEAIKDFEKAKEIDPKTKNTEEKIC